MPQTEKYVCFSCRKVARCPSGNVRLKLYCPTKDCGRRMVFVGGDFKTPKQCDIAGWKRSEKWARQRYRDA